MQENGSSPSHSAHGDSGDRKSAPVPVGDRLAAQSARLRLLLHHMAGRAVRARVDPDDLVQEVLLRALTAPGGLPDAEPGDAALYRWLRRIARNTVVDVARAIRAGKREARFEPLARSDWSRAGLRASGLGDPGPGPATRVAAREEEERIERAFESLAPDHRRVIGLRQFEGLTAEEAGLRMGRSEVAVHSLYRRALLAWEAAAAR